MPQEMTSRMMLTPGNSSSSTWLLKSAVRRRLIMVNQVKVVDAVLMDVVDAEVDVVDDPLLVITLEMDASCTHKVETQRSVLDTATLKTLQVMEVVVVILRGITTHLFKVLVTLLVDAPLVDIGINKVVASTLKVMLMVDVVAEDVGLSVAAVVAEEQDEDVPHLVVVMAVVDMDEEDLIMLNPMLMP